MDGTYPPIMDFIPGEERDERSNPNTCDSPEPPRDHYHDYS